MSTLSTYNEITDSREVIKRIMDEPIVSPAEEAYKAQQKLDWLNNSVTLQMISSINKEVEDLERQARVLALSFPQTNNHQQIIQCLVKADALRKVVKNYASRE